MRFEAARAIVDQLPRPHINADRGRMLYEHITRTRPARVLELGTARGGSAVFISAALSANGMGHLVSVDSCLREWRSPSPEQTLTNAGLCEFVTLDRRFSTYTWFLMERLEERMANPSSADASFDLVFLDGSKNWTTDGLAVVLAEKILAPGGWLVMDDLGWTYEEHSYGPVHYGVELARLSAQEREQPHLRAVFDLLVKGNAAFCRFVDDDGWWGWAMKRDDETR